MEHVNTQILRVTQGQGSHLTVKRNMKKSDVTIQMQVLSDNTVERSGDENGLYGGKKIKSNETVTQINYKSHLTKKIVLTRFLV